MTDGFDQALADAGLNLLRADTGLTVYDGVVPNGVLVAGQPVPPFVVVYTSLTRPTDAPSEALALAGLSNHYTASWYCHCVGGNAVAARAVAQRVRTQLLDVRPVITGLSCGLIRQAESQPPSKDETTGVLVMDALRVFELYAST